MNKEQALHQFFNSFGVPAYDEGTVPDNAPDTRITYSVAIDNYDAICPLNVSIWDRSESWGKVTELSHSIAQRLNEMGRIRIDDGLVYLTRGTPFAQRMTDSDKSIRRIVININAQFLTEI